MNRTYDFVSLGGGPAGTAAAIRAAQLGARAAVVESSSLGGTCLNTGCIPTKTLLYSSEIYGLTRRMVEFGTVIYGENRLDFSRLKRRQERIVKQLQTGLAQVLESYGVTVINGRGKVLGKERISVQSNETTEELFTKSILICTGSKPQVPSFLTVDGQRVMTSDHVLAMDILPAELVILGGGAVGVEFATFFQTLGLPVVLQERESRLLPQEDVEISQELEKQLTRLGVTVKTGDASQPSEKKTVLAATGRKPAVEDLGLEEARVALDKGFVQTDEHMMTSVSGIYAAGDVAGKTLFAYGASQEGIVAAENASGHKSVMDHRFIPRSIFCQPNVASVGLTEEQAKTQGPTLVGRFSLAANPRASIIGLRHGLVKIVAEEKSHKVLGIHMVGHEVTEHIAGCALALKLGAKLEDFSREIFPHPTMAEAIHAAAEDALGRCVDLPKKAAS